MSITKTAEGGMVLDADAGSAMLLKLESKSAAVRAWINGILCNAARDATGVWIIGRAAPP